MRRRIQLVTEAVYSLDNNLSPLVQTLPTAGKSGRACSSSQRPRERLSVTFNGVAASFTDRV